MLVKPLVKPLVKSLVSKALAASAAVASYIKTNRVVDLFTNFTSASTTVADKSGEGNDATLKTGIYAISNGTTDRLINADCSALGLGDYYFTGKVRSNTIGVKTLTPNGGVDAAGATVTVADVWQDFTTTTAVGITPSNVQLIGSSTCHWSDVKLHKVGGGVIPRWQLNDSDAADLNGYPAIDSGGEGFHGVHDGGSSGSAEADILQLAGMDYNVDTTTYAGKTVFVPEALTAGTDALGNAIANPRPNGKVARLTGHGGTLTLPADASLDTIRTVSGWVRYDGTDKVFIDLGTPTISTAAGVLTSSGFTAPTYHVNGALTTTLGAAGWKHIMVTSTAALDCDDIDQQLLDQGSLLAYSDTKVTYDSIHNLNAQKTSYGLAGLIASPAMTFNGATMTFNGVAMTFNSADIA